MPLKALFCLILFFVGASASSQQKYLEDRWSYKLGFSKYEEYRNRRKLQFAMSADYGFSPYLEAGAYIGYVKFGWFDDSRRGLFCGLASNFHVIPFLLRKGDPRIDLYIGQRFGGLYLKNPTGSYAHEPDYHLDIGLHFGVTYYLKRNWGVFLEKGYANGFGTDYAALDYYRKYIRFGISIKH